MNKQDSKALQDIEAAKQKMLRGTWTSPDTTVKKTNWYIQVHEGQTAGKAEAGRIVFVAKSRGSFQFVELTEQKGKSTDKLGLPVSLWVGKVLQ
jgi:hypothetical protein